MGSWNETCVVTRLPIGPGMPVVSLTTVYGPRFQTRVDGLNTDLLFGLPIVGAYDDYGGVEDEVTPGIRELHERAFANAGFYRKVMVDKGFGSKETWWLASHPDTLWGLAEAVKPVYYPELGLLPSEIECFENGPRAKTLTAYRNAEAALSKLGEQIGKAMFKGGSVQVQDQLFHIFEEVFGKERAWAAWTVISKKGLFARPGHIMMHLAAYQAMVKEFGQRRVGQYPNKAKTSLRSFVTEKLDLLKRLYLDESASKPKTNYALDRSLLPFRPMTSLWRSPEIPLSGHFWGGASISEILAVVPDEDIVDFFIFQWARNYMRFDLTLPGGGSQNQEVVLTDKVFKATMKSLVAQEFARKDFDGMIFNF